MSPPSQKSGQELTSQQFLRNLTPVAFGGLHGHVVQGQESLAQLGLFHEPRAGGEGAQRGEREPGLGVIAMFTLHPQTAVAAMVCLQVALRAWTPALGGGC